METGALQGVLWVPGVCMVQVWVVGGRMLEDGLAMGHVQRKVAMYSRAISVNQIAGASWSTAWSA